MRGTGGRSGAPPGKRDRSDHHSRGLAAKAATATIPIVSETAGDPIKLSLVASLNRPGGNITGVTRLSSELVSKRPGLLHNLIPAATMIGLLVNPTARNVLGTAWLPSTMTATTRMCRSRYE